MCFIYHFNGTFPLTALKASGRNKKKNIRLAYAQKCFIYDESYAVGSSYSTFPRRISNSVEFTELPPGQN